ncbi:formate dehydrogenase subunit delta [Xanthobacteraceae bacterium A53D]
MSHSHTHDHTHDHAHGDAHSHTSTDDRLVYMANQIATFFGSQQHDAAVAGTRDHIRKFWDPRMRARIAELLVSGGEKLKPIAREALEGLSAKQ